MAERLIFTAVADTLTVAIPKAFNGTVTFLCGTGTLTCIPELSADDGTTWEVATVTKLDKTTAASLAGGVSGWCEAPGYTHARLRCSAFTSQTGANRVTAREG